MNPLLAFSLPSSKGSDRKTFLHVLSEVEAGFF